MKQAQHNLIIRSDEQALKNVTREISRWVSDQGISTGLLTVFLRHTSASLVIQENADTDVLDDLRDFFARVVPADASLYRHAAEGPDDMPAHIKAALTQTHLSIPVSDGRPTLGTWQAIYLFEHRAAPHSREIVLHLVGE
jgi:secondary thiamine-phosphate synthase enzyme